MRSVIFLGSLFFTKNPSKKTFQKQMCYTNLLLGLGFWGLGFRDLLVPQQLPVSKTHREVSVWLIHTYKIHKC